MRRDATTLAWGAGCSAILLFNVAAGLDRPLEKTAPPTYRYWEDFAVALRDYRGTEPAAPAAAAPGNFEAAKAEIARLGIRPWQFWRTADPRAFALTPDAAIRAYEDTGRARLLATAFRALGGVAPVALFWPAALLVVPVLVWTAWETTAAGHGVAGGTFLLLVALSAFVADALPLAYSPIGFYVAAALLIVPWSTYLLGGPSLTVRGLLARATGLAAALVVATNCRGGVLLLLPGFLLPLLALRRRVLPRRGLVASVVIALLTVPPVAARSLGGHDFWIGVWEGLGDFDRERGHVWSDADAKRFARARGFDDLRDPAAQRAFRDEAIGSIRADPAWFADILARRLAVTLSQWKLWPRGTIRPSTHRNEGAQDGYYSLVRGVDVFAFGGRAVEVPVPVLLAGPLVLLARAGWRRRSGVAAAPELAVLGSFLAGLLAPPVLISTASALETQAAALAWLLAWAFVVEGGISRLRRPRGPSTAPAEVTMLEPA